MESPISLPTALVSTSETEVGCYLDEVPAFAELELERLYNTLHSSLPFFRHFRTMKSVSTYVAWRGGQPAVILLFQVKGRTVHVLNEMIDLAQEEVERFASCVFARLPRARIVSFKAIRTTVDRFAYPVQKHNAKETFVITLPATPEQYIAKLNKNLREQIPYKLRKIERRHPTFTSAFHEKEEIPDQVLRDLIRLSEERIAQKTSAFAHDEARIIALAKECGFVHVLTIDGKVCAGTINYFIGSNVFLELLARDPAYSSFSIGVLTMYLSACESIRRGKRKYLLGGGRFDYKQKLLGVLSEADRVEIYRSHGIMLIHLANAVATLAHAYVRRAKVWVHANKTHPVSRLASSVFAR